MAAHRYWRASGLTPYGGGALDLSEFQLIFAGSRVDAAATLSSSAAPTSGALADLKDNTLGTGARWSAPAGLVLQWDFGGSPSDVDDICLGAADTDLTFPQIAVVDYSDDTVTWTRAFVAAGISYPGARTKTTSVDLGFWDIESRSGNMRLDGTRRGAGMGDGSGGAVRGEASASSGVRQFEIFVPIGYVAGMGVAQAGLGGGQIASDVNAWVRYSSGNFKSVAGVTSAYGTTPATPETHQFVVDFTAGTLTAYRKGVSEGVLATGLAGKTLWPVVGSLNQMYQFFTLKTQNFAYPIAGATPWQSGTFIARDAQRGLSRPDMAGFSSQPGALIPQGSFGAFRLIGADKGRVFSWGRDGTANVMNGRVKGTTKDKGSPSNVPVSERVRLYRQRDGLLVGETWSVRGTGAYSFDYVDATEAYTVLSYDQDATFRAVVADGLTIANGGVELIA